MPKVTEAIQNFLAARKAAHNGPDLLERWTPYMETQVNVSAGKGWAVDGKKSTYTDGMDEWWNIRIPKNAYAMPEFRDYELSWPIDVHAEAIGCTGWDWCARRSRWVAFDFDSITGHAKGVGIGDTELSRVSDAAKALPWVEVRKSTGGNGLHLYVYLDTTFVVENHTVHAALARAVLGMMSSAANFDFASHIDACGGNMWIWSRKMTQLNEGLRLVKAAERSLSDGDIPANWKDNIEVVERRRAKIRVNGIEEANQDPFEALASSRRIVQLDNNHKAVIDALQESGYSTLWVTDHHLLQTHTAALAMLMEEQKSQLNLLGFFKTSSQGRNRGTPNCFAFPLDLGGWKVYRFSPGISEAETWEQDGNGWTTCYFNRQPNLKVAARAMGGSEDPEKGGYVFDTATQALQAASALGQNIVIPDEMLARETRIKAHKDGRLIVQVTKKADDEGMKKLGWLAKKDYWLQVYETRAEVQGSDDPIREYDNLIRALTTVDGKRAGWVVRQKTNEWDQVPKDDIRSLLASRKVEVEVVLGKAVEQAWRLVNMPFQPEYPGNRQWNFNAAQFVYNPANLGDDEAPHHPHWDMILRHCGQDLDEPLQNLEWARSSNIKTGADYLLAWAACMFREPLQPLPYLFFYSPKQNTGKSIFHEALRLLMTSGYASADRALVNANDFNGELANAVLAYIEERDVGKSPGAYNKLKDWVTSPVLWIRKMRTDAYSQPNTLHFVHTAQSRESCPVYTGDTRITMMFVPDLKPGEEIPKSVLLDRLKQEAPHFMRTIMDLQLPTAIGRLRLPIVGTNNKQQAEEMTRSPIEAFIADQCFEVAGEVVLFADFYERFQEWLPPEDKGDWSSKQKIIRSLQDKWPYGAYTANKRCVGNLSWEKIEPKPEAKPFLILNGRLIAQ